MPTSKPTTKSAASSSSSSKAVPPAAAPAVAVAPTATPPSSTAPLPAAPPPTATPPAAPDPNVALAAFAQQAVATIDAIAAGLGTDPSLTPKDKIRAAKFRKGGEPIVSTIGDLAQQQNLEAPALPVATMLALLGQANALAPLANRLAAFVTLVEDIMFAAQSQAWGMALTYYALLQRSAKSNNKLATSLDPVTQFLQYRHPSTKPAVGQPTKKQVNAAKKAQKALATIAGGKLATTDLLKSSNTAAEPSADATSGGS
ncbi:MAG TPA: hypothetical protein VHS09_07900, partial [Polyangiaceae bacterium]|nr:hypothetical protein [Polyangiaceae bacterium]